MKGDAHDLSVHPRGPGSASGAPHLSAGFTGTFTSRYIDTGDVRPHAVIGVDGPLALLIHGWPGSWYYWRLVMPALARDFSVITVDQSYGGAAGAGALAHRSEAAGSQRPGREVVQSRVPGPSPRLTGHGAPP